MSTITLRSILFASTLALVAGCKDDVTKEKAAWDTTSKDFANQFDVAKKALDGLLAKAKALQVPADLNGGAAQKAAVDGAVKAAEGGVKAVEAALSTGKSAVDAAFAAGKRDAVVAAMDAAKTAISPALVKATEALGAATRQLGDLDKALTDAKAAADKAQAEAAAVTAMINETAHKKGATVELAAIAFKGTEVDAEAAPSKAELEKLAVFFKACELKADLKATVVSAAKDAKAVSTKRGEAVKAWLVANGVDAKRIGKIDAHVAKDGAEKVTMTVETACK